MGKPTLASVLLKIAFKILAGIISDNKLVMGVSKPVTLASSCKQRTVLFRSNPSTVCPITSDKRDRRSWTVTLRFFNMKFTSVICVALKLNRVGHLLLEPLLPAIILFYSRNYFFKKLRSNLEWTYRRNRCHHFLKWKKKNYSLSSSWMGIEIFFNRNRNKIEKIH